MTKGYYRYETMPSPDQITLRSLHFDDKGNFRPDSKLLSRSPAGKLLLIDFEDLGPYNEDNYRRIVEAAVRAVSQVRDHPWAAAHNCRIGWYYYPWGPISYQSFAYPRIASYQRINAHAACHVGHLLDYGAGQLYSSFSGAGSWAEWENKFSFLRDESFKHGVTWHPHIWYDKTSFPMWRNVILSSLRRESIKPIAFCRAGEVYPAQYLAELNRQLGQ